MSLIGVTKAAALVGLSRKTLYKHISKGKLSRGAGGLMDTSELLRVYGAFVEQVTPVTDEKVTQGDKIKGLGDRTISMTADELETIIKQAVKAALIEAIPLLIEHKPEYKTEYKQRLKTKGEIQTPDFLAVQRLENEMLTHESRLEIIEMVELWVYKTNKAPSELLRVIDTDKGFKVGVLDYIDTARELVTKEDNCNENQAKAIRQRIIEAVNK